MALCTLNFLQISLNIQCDTTPPACAFCRSCGNGIEPNRFTTITSSDPSIFLQDNLTRTLRSNCVVAVSNDLDFSHISNHRSRHFSARPFPFCRRPPTHGARIAMNLQERRESHSYSASRSLYPFTHACVCACVRAHSHFARNADWTRVGSVGPCIGPAATKSWGVTNGRGKGEKDGKGGNNGTNVQRNRGRKRKGERGSLSLSRRSKGKLDCEALHADLQRNRWIDHDTRR